MKQPFFLSRRALLKLLGALPAFFLLGSRVGAAPLPLTPDVPDHDDDDPTPSETEGPYFKPKSPERRSLREASVTGTALVVTGRVLSTSGAPVANALIDVWHCDAAGEYDNSGFKLRGHQYTDKDGRYRLETIVPGVYPGRTRHIHVKVQAPHQAVLTTQLYFPGDAGNARDGLYMRRLEMVYKAGEKEKTGLFDFVVRA